MTFLPALFAALALVQSPVDDLPAKYRVAPPGPQTAVARVNGVEITAGDVESLLWDWRGADAIQDLISYQIVKSEAKKQNVDVSEQDVENSIDTFLKEAPKQMRPGASLADYLASQGMTRSRLYMRFRTQLLLQKLVERSFDPKKLVKVDTIVFRPASAQTTDLEAAIRKANDAFARLQKGETWDAVLASTTENPQVRASKGLLGWRDLSIFPASVQKELLSLKPGGITKPAQTEVGIQIFRLEALGESATKEEIKDARAAYLGSSFQPLLERLRKEAKIDRIWQPPTGISQKGGN